MSRLCHALPVWLLAVAAFVFGCASPHNPASVPDRNTSAKADGVESSDSKITTPYDQRIISAIQARWHDLVRKKKTVQGKVVVEFELLKDGRVRGLRAVETTVDGWQTKLCLQAIEDTSPFPRWPQSLVEQTKSDTRSIRLTFHYN